MGEGEGVLQPHGQHVRAEPPVRRLHAGRVEEVAGVGVRAGHMSQGSEQLEYLLLQSSWELCRGESVLVFDRSMSS